MILDSERQRETLLNCIASCQLSGMVSQLIPVIQEIAEVEAAVKDAQLGNASEKQAAEPSLRVVNVE